jgi:aryl-alcohol dehydrogenase-like predicted oxidoreductase
MKKEKLSYSRRDFLSTSVKGAATLSTAGILASCVSGSEDGKQKNKNENEIDSGTMPTRILGKTGLSVSILSFGGGSQFLMNENGEWEKHLEEAVKKGINMFDTSPDYTVVSRGGKKVFSSEERFGQILPAYRDQVIISTKINEREAAKARKSLEESLKRLKMDYVDILMIHAINEKDSVSQIENGVYAEIMKMKSEGMVKHIGFSSMDSAQRSKELLQALDFDVTLLAMNPSKWGNFPDITFPVAIEKNVGLIGMKIVRDLVGKPATAEELLTYAWDKGVNSSLIGNVGIDILNENINLAIKYGKKQLATIDTNELETRLNPYAGPHALIWAQPGYKDGGIIV